MADYTSVRVTVNNALDKYGGPIWIRVPTVTVDEYGDETRVYTTATTTGAVLPISSKDQDLPEGVVRTTEYAFYCKWTENTGSTKYLTQGCEVGYPTGNSCEWYRITDIKAYPMSGYDVAYKALASRILS